MCEKDFVQFAREFIDDIEEIVCADGDQLRNKIH